MRFVELCKCFGMLLVPFAIAFQTGCDVSSRVGNIPTEEVDISDFTFPAPSQAPASGYEFETPVRIMAGGEYVSVESPGYACPTMADVDEDGKLDLVVGQFNGGKMHYCKNTRRLVMHQFDSTVCGLEPGRKT